MPDPHRLPNCLPRRPQRLLDYIRPDQVHIMQVRAQCDLACMAAAPVAVSMRGCSTCCGRSALLGRGVGVHMRHPNPPATLLG